MEMYRRTYAEINLENLAHNIQVIRKALPRAAFLCPMIKANAYGHGDVQVARFLESLGIQHLGVCLIEEGLLLRNFGVKAEILVFRGFDLAGAKEIIDYNLTPVVSSWEQLSYLESLATTPVGIHLKFDTGMNRLGFNISEAQALYDRLWQNKKIRLKALVSHLLNGEDAADAEGRSGQQLRDMHQVGKIFKSFQIFSHVLNSAGMINLILSAANKGSEHPLQLENWGLRPGLMIYGYNPLDRSDVQAKAVNLKPAMSLKSVASVLRHLAVGETVSYGGTWQARRASVIAVVPIGYADGYHRILSSQAYALFAGIRVPVVGNVCMDYLMFDVTDVVSGKDLSEFKEAEVVLFGQSQHGAFLSAAELAEKGKSITWEMLTSVGERVPRIFVGATESFVTHELKSELKSAAEIEQIGNRDSSSNRDSERGSDSRPDNSGGPQ